MQGQICDFLRPQLAMNRFLPPSGHTDSHTLDTYIWGEGRGSDIRSTYLQVSMPTSVFYPWIRDPGVREEKNQDQNRISFVCHTFVLNMCSSPPPPQKKAPQLLTM
jgi:hypothetical protein